MVADDDPAIVDALKLMLEFAEYDVITTEDGNEVRNLKGRLPDLLLLDIWMSGENGREICKKLKSQQSTKSLPVILISASREVEKSARDAGAEDFIAKPFEMDELLNKIEKYVQ